MSSYELKPDKNTNTKRKSFIKNGMKWILISNYIRIYRYIYMLSQSPPTKFTQRPDAINEERFNGKWSVAERS